jgi:hypothetical protein
MRIEGKKWKDALQQICDPKSIRTDEPSSDAFPWEVRISQNNLVAVPHSMQDR